MDQEKIGKIIREIRIKNNLTQDQFANFFGVTYQAVSKWENGKNIPDISIIKDICKRFNLSVEDFLAGEAVTLKRNNKKKVVIISIIVLIIIMIISILLVIQFHNDSFEFKQISTSCENFNLTGSMAYNKDKTSIYISNINYCGKENDEVYDTITCKLYESSEKMNSLITTCKSDSKTTIKDYLKKVNIGVNNYTSMCQKYNDSSLYLEVETHKGDQITTYKIPISIDDNC